MHTSSAADPPRLAVPAPEAARMLGVSQRYLEELRAQGTGPRYSKFGRAVRYSVSGLHDWLNAQQVHPRSR